MQSPAAKTPGTVVCIFRSTTMAPFSYSSPGTSLVTESVWSSRFKYVDELKRMGAQIQVDGKVAVVEGVDHLEGAPIQACDLRAGAAMVIAALAAHGTTEITQVQYIERGYEDIIGKLRAVGADIRLVDEPDPAGTVQQAG